jgi:flagellar motility protein MotE (MotC chaperone)
MASSAAAWLPANAETTAPEDKSIQAVIEEYCTAVSDQAGEQRMAREKQALSELQLKVEKRLNDLEKAKSELQEQLDRREELRNLAKKELVEIYAGMDPAAAAAQMDEVDMRLASSIIRQLKPRQASAILDEMRPELAAKLVRYIAIAAAAEEAGN